MLTRHAFDSPSPMTSRNALRVLANAMLLKPSTRQTFVDMGYESKLCDVMKRDSFDDEFLVSRILFLTTYETNIKLEPIIEQYHLAEIMTERLAKHVAVVQGQSTKAGKAKADPMEDMALAEILRLLFNVTHFCSEKVTAFTQTIPHILVLLLKRDLPTTKPLDPPFGSLVNTLINLDLSSENVQSSFYPENDPNAIATKLIELLDLSLKQYKDNDLEQTVTPLVGVIRTVHENGPHDVRQFIRNRLLPTEEDRNEVLGHSETLASRLLRNTTNPLTPQLRELISHLLYEMSDKDPSKFVEHVGYGFASGFLFQNNIPVPESASGGSVDETKKAFNPITGQFLDREKFADVPEMTDEEKEREAERLFVLFERLVVSHYDHNKCIVLNEHQTQKDRYHRCGKSSHKGVSRRPHSGA